MMRKNKGSTLFVDLKPKHGEQEKCVEKRVHSSKINVKIKKKNRKKKGCIHVLFWLAPARV